MLKSDIKSCPSATARFFQARCATELREVQWLMDDIIRAWNISLHGNLTNFLDKLIENLHLMSQV